MKTKLLAAVMAMFFLSCSSDDSSTEPTNENPDVEKHIKDITNFSPDGQGGWDYLGIKKFVNGMPTEEYFGSDVAAPNISILYTYDDENRITDLDWHTISGQNLHITFTYDSSGRLLTKHIVSGNSGGISSQIQHTDYDYSITDEVGISLTITQSDSGGTNNEYYNSIAYLNSDGYIYKRSNIGENANYSEVTYQNGNIVAYNAFSYDSALAQYVTTSSNSFGYIDQEVKGEYVYTLLKNNFVISLETNLFGDNKANAELHNGGFTESMTAYMSEFVANGALQKTHTYQFDEDGYPVEVHWISADGEDYNKEVITYY